jgi:hypothetical protein
MSIQWCENYCAGTNDVGGANFATTTKKWRMVQPLDRMEMNSGDTWLIIQNCYEYPWWALKYRLEASTIAW